MSKKCMVSILVGIAAISCTDMGNEPRIGTPTEEIIPTTVAFGPGGEAYIQGNIRDYLRPAQPVRSAHLFALNHRNYNDTVVHVEIRSTDATFLVKQLPLDTFDLIFTHQSFFSRKIPHLVSRRGGNSFNNPGSTGYFVDSTLFSISVADSYVVGRTPLGAIGYGPGVFATFKLGVPDSQSLRIALQSGCDTLRVYHHHDPFDPKPGDLYDLRCGSLIHVYDTVAWFNWKKEIQQCGPWLLQAIGKNEIVTFQDGERTYTSKIFFK